MGEPLKRSTWPLVRRVIGWTLLASGVAFWAALAAAYAFEVSPLETFAATVRIEWARAGDK